MYKFVFRFLLFWTLLILFIYVTGYVSLTSVMIIVVVDLIALGAIIEMGKRESFKEINTEISSKLDNIEKVCQNILSSSSGDTMLQKIEEKLSKQKDDVSYLFDRMSRKMLELEEKINKFGVSLAEHLEEGMDEKKYGEENSFNIGETVYVEDEYANVEESDESQE